MKHSELRHQPRHVNPRIQDEWQKILKNNFIVNFFYFVVVI